MPLCALRRQALRKAAFAAQAVRPIEANPDFEKQLRAAAQGAKGIVFACNSGGTIRCDAKYTIDCASGITA